MSLSTRFLVSVLALSWIVLAVCPNKGPDTEPLRQTAAVSPVAALPAQLDGQLSGNDRSHLATKRTRRELSISTYNNPEYGVSFRYPRNYALEEGNVQEHSYFLKRQEELSIEQPGATLIATVLIPEDAYPNTTFEHGSLQLVTNEFLTEESCGQVFGSTEASTLGIKGLAVPGLQFQGTETTLSPAGTRVLERDYAGFLDGTCYEVSLVVAGGDTSGESTKLMDSRKIIGQLEKIVLSLRVLPKRRVPMPGPSTETAARL